MKTLEEKKGTKITPIILYDVHTYDEVEEIVKQYFVKEGLLLDKQTVVKNMSNDNISVEAIAKYTSLTTDEVKNIINKNKS